MTDKEKIRAEIERLQDGLMDAQGRFRTNAAESAYHILCHLENFIDSMQEEPQVKESAEIQHIKETCKENINSLTPEPVNKDFEMALAEMVDKAQKCVVEPLVIAEQWKDELIKLAKSEEPVSEIDFEQELYKYFGQVKDFTLGMRIAKWFYDMGKNSQEPISEDLDSFAKRQADEFAEREYEVGSYDRGYLSKGYYWGCKRGAKWQKEQLLAKAVDGTVRPDDGEIWFDFKLFNFEDGDKVKVIIIKEDKI